jgi:hypothetical protein
MKNSTLIHDVTPEQFQEVIFQVVKTQFEILKKEFKPKEPTEYLTRTEVSEWLKCDISTVHNWTKSGRLIPYGIANRVYYKRSEVESALKPFGKNKGEKEV